MTRIYQQGDIMELCLSYRPFGGNFIVWNTLDNELSQHELRQVEKSHFSSSGTDIGEDDEWFVCVATYKGAFHSLNVLDRHGRGSLWSGLSLLVLNETTVDLIGKQMDSWDNEVSDPTDIKNYITNRFRTTMMVA